MTPSVGSIDLESVAELAIHSENRGIEAGIYIRQGRVDVKKAIIPRCPLSCTSWVAGATGQTVRSGMLYLVLCSVEGVAGHQTIQINCANQLSAPAPLISKLEYPIPNWFKLRLIGKDVHIRVWFVRQSSK